MGCQSSSPLSSSSSPDHLNSSSSLSPTLLKIISPNMELINPAEYRISHYIAAGGVGLVYSAVHHVNNKKIAMKFFGYVEKPAVLSEIYHEIELFSAISGLQGLVQMKGIFMDSPNGYVNDKFTRTCYPVICMELMEGGDLFDRISTRKTVSEKFVARIFKAIMLALEGLHRRGYIHCDLKLENVMFTSMDDDAQVKLIDFGMMVPLPPEGIYYSETIHGTAGYVAPESIKNYLYSPKSDIWQAGCILYSLLSGFQAFNPNYPELIVQGRFMKMSGIGWDNISAEAKDLITKIFNPNPLKRYTIEQILAHNWLAGSAPDQDMGEQYYQRIRQRALRQRMKNVVFNRDIMATNNETKEKLKRILPLIKPRKKQRRTRSSVVRGSIKPSDVESFESGNSNPPIFHHPSELPSLSLSSSKSSLHSSTAQKSPTIRRPVYRPVLSLDDIDLMRRTRDRTASIEVLDNDGESKVNDDFDVKISSLKTAFVQQTVEVARKKTNEKKKENDSEKTTGEIDLETFVRVLRECGLPELATPQMFHIFDPKKTGKIDLKEFLITMVAFRDTSHTPDQEVSHPSSPTEIDRDEVDNEEELIQFYFNMFDFENTGQIALDEMKIVVRCIFADKYNHDKDADPNELPTANDIETMFENVLELSDLKTKETINYEEFKLFYSNLFIPSSNHAHPHPNHPRGTQKRTSLGKRQLKTSASDLSTNK